MKKKKLAKKLAKALANLSKSEDLVKVNQANRKAVMKEMIDAGYSVKEVADLTGLTRQMVYKIVGK